MYEKQNFYSGQKLMASHLEAMEDGIIEALNKETVSSWNDLTNKPFGEEVVDGETIIKQIDPKYIPEDVMGVGSWDDLTNKPFGEELIEFVEWDGNVGDNIVVNADDLSLVNISEVTITDISDLIGAVVTCSISGGEPTEITFTESDTKEMAPGIIVNQSCYMFITTVDGFDLDGVVFPKRGIYVPASDLLPILISKIVFPKPVIGIKQLDAKYIPSTIFPEQVPPTWEDVLDKPFYEAGFEYTWDGEIGDRETVVDTSNGVTFVYMGDARTTRADLKTKLVAEVIRDGVAGIIDASGPVYKFVSEWDDKYYPDVTILKDLERDGDPYWGGTVLGAIASKDRAKGDGYVFPHRGVYFAKSNEKPECYCTKLTLPHSTQKWESEYLPIPSLGQLKTFNNIKWSTLPSIELRNYTSGNSNFQALYKVSDDVIENVSQIMSAMWNHYHNGSRVDHSLWNEQTSYIYNGDGWFAIMVRGTAYYIPAVLCATRDNVTINGAELPKLGETPTGFGFTKTITIPTKGLYVGREQEYSYSNSYSYLSELTVRLNPNKIDPKYLPPLAVDMSEYAKKTDIENFQTAEQVKALINESMEAIENGTY